MVLPGDKVWGQGGMFMRNWCEMTGSVTSSRVTYWAPLMPPSGVRPGTRQGGSQGLRFPGAQVAERGAGRRTSARTPQSLQNSEARPVCRKTIYEYCS